jgi:hypothetical protein
MSLGAVPDDGEILIGGRRVPGRRLRAVYGEPVDCWVSQETLPSAGLIWTELGEESAESGLQPFLLSGMDGGTARPWGTGEQVSEPEDTGRIDRMDAARQLEGWWEFPGEDEIAENEDLRTMFAPFGPRFPGLAPAVGAELAPELMRQAVSGGTRDARIGRVYRSETEGRAANARRPDTKIRAPATMNIRLTELRVTPANEARKLRRTVLVSQPEATTESIDASWLTGVNTAITRPRYSRGTASRSSGATAVFSMAIGMA